jgi:hypothetical protein
MRITKKWLRETKESLSERIKQLLLMSQAEVRAEHCARYPNRHADRRGAVEQQRRDLIVDVIEQLIPPHLID